MAAILKSCENTREREYIYILVVGSTIFCHELKNSLHYCSKKNDVKLKVHISNNIQDILNSELQPEVDYIVFGINTQHNMCLEQLENNIKQVENFLKFGHMCFVNNDTIKRRETAVNFNELWEMKNKYGANLLNGNVESKSKSLYLAERILNLAIMTLGVKTGIPYIDYPNTLKPLE